MHEFAEFAVRTESGQVIGAENASDMAMPAMGSMSAESPVVPRTVLDLALRIDVQEGALFVVAGVEPRIEVALGHLGHVVFVQEFALVTLFAEATQPMLADDCAIAADVSERAGGALFALQTVGPVEELTHGGRGLWRGGGS